MSEGCPKARETLEGLSGQGRTDSEGLGFSSCAAPLTRIGVRRKSEDVRRKSEDVRRTSEGAGNFGRTFWTGTRLVLSKSRQRKGCKDKVRSRIGPEDRGKDPDRLPELRMSGGVEERRSGGAEERRSGGAELWPREKLPRPEMDIN
ncbi:hypothetical protein C8R48DRAFT_673797 [Suillus tomentosus]|nr:hypothetical protein C8R48DRAFT_673797 [Suillus tomentosus]